MAISMPATVVLIVCKVAILGGDQNSTFTKWENTEWATENSMMICRRTEVQMYDSAEAMGADPQGFNTQRCMAAAIRLGAQWDIDHQGTTNPYRTWRVACPVEIREDVTGNGPSPDDPVVGYVLPDCGHRDTVVCDTDNVI